MPLAGMRAAAADATALSVEMGDVSPLGEADALAQELLAWFKTGFFSWVRTFVFECAWVHLQAAYACSVCACLKPS